jgi:peptidyl-prolyl cis-trans isomerase SurA
MQAYKARLLRPLALAALAATGAAGGLRAQDETQDPVVIDRVVAVVGNRPVLASQVDEQLFTMVSQPNAPAPKTAADTAALRKQIVSDIVDDELIIQEAQRDTSIKVTEQEVADGVEQSFRNVRTKFTSEPEFRDELRKAGFLSAEEWRRFLNDQTRREFLKSRMLEKLKSEGKLKPVQPTEAEMREFFDAQKGQLGNRPATVSFRQVAIAPRPTQSAKARALAQADSIVIELRKGADFATAARRFSDDIGSKDQGGSLGWSRRGSWVPEFEKVAFSLRPGTISDPVESPFGYHIIQVERVQPGEVQARHILIQPEVGPEQVDSAAALAERVRAAAVAGAPFDSLQRAHHDPSEEREALDVQLTKLPEAYAKAVGDAPAGTILPVFSLESPDGRKKFIVLRVSARVPEGEVRFEDVRERVRARLGENLAIRRYLDRLRRNTFVEVRQG